MQNISARLWRGTLYGGVILFLTWLFFGPVAGFHHMIRLGLLGPLFLDGDSPESCHLMWGEYQVVFSLTRLLISLLLWAVCLVYALRFCGALLSAASASRTQTAEPSGRLRISVICGIVIALSGLVPSLASFFIFSNPVMLALLTIVALVGGYCSVTSIFAERGFKQTVAILCFVLSLSLLLRYSAFLIMLIP